MTPPTSPGATLLSRAALALYPPSWRARYEDEVRALLDDSGGGLAAVASVAWRAVPAWICPPRHLHDRPARMRSSLAAAAAGVAATVMAVAAAAIVVAVVGLCLWARHFTGYHHGTIPGLYLALVVVAATVTAVSAARGTRAALAEP